MPVKLTRVVLTMDCERVRTSQFYPAGPLSWEESARNISAFAGVVERHGCRATLFEVPEAIEAHADLFKQLLAAGHEVGLHLHPHTFRHGVNEYLGNLPEDRQAAILAEAKHAFEAAMGFAPTSFRPGHFSANADTFRILASLGFSRGSSGIPGRYRAGTGSDWRDWPRQCHYVGSVFEVPVTVHRVPLARWRAYATWHALTLARRGFVVDALRGMAATVRGLGCDSVVQGTSLVDLRIEDGGWSLIKEIVDAELARAGRAGQPAVLTAVTHSYVNYSAQDRGSSEYGMSRQRHLKRLFDYLGGRRNHAIESRTLSEVQRDFDTGRLST